jgi:hypothetical protein
MNHDNASIIHWIVNLPVKPFSTAQSERQAEVGVLKYVDDQLLLIPIPELPFQK